MPSDLLPPPPVPAAAGTQGQPATDWSLLGLICQWRVVVAEVAEVYGLDLYDPAVRRRPWPGIRTMIFALLDRPGGLLRAALTYRGAVR